MASALTLSLAACGSGIVKPDDGTLEATAVTPSGIYAFNCHPTGQGGGPVEINDDMSFSCSSADAKANLTVLLKKTTSTVEEKSVTKRSISVVLLIYGPPAVNYAALDENASYGGVLNRSLSGSFTATPTKGITIKGKFNFSAD
ncbi:hypothetical protein EHF33_04815 [Deinococcus psychrotolerans]|uniref:Uncharacterized protein n=1 Tax=Deinococcus psychrotolerans TaxID=2489213 RepID=A0A3G8YB42_9DEIO|nr:hypothetical protein [Deinococcus psychrotolerans]AZI42150.1 hypothetical protein EHF33_04815 [Deinococcus psychrotolerans]